MASQMGTLFSFRQIRDQLTKSPFLETAHEAGGVVLHD